MCFAFADVGWGLVQGVRFGVLWVCDLCSLNRLLLSVSLDLGWDWLLVLTLFFDFVRFPLLRCFVGCRGVQWVGLLRRFEVELYVLFVFVYKYGLRVQMDFVAGCDFELCVVILGLFYLLFGDAVVCLWFGCLLLCLWVS